MTKKRIAAISAVLILALLVAVVPAVASVPAGGQGYQADSAQYNGATAGLGFRQQGMTLVHITADLDAPVGFENAFGAYAVLRVNGKNRAYSRYDRDTNGDAHISFYFPDIRVWPGDVVSVWISDPWTRYDKAHPAIRV
jgi:hypothetical protein